MKGTELKTLLESIRLPQADLAKIIGVTSRSVSGWVAAEAEVPGPVSAYLRVFLQLSPVSQEAERARARGQVEMIDGLYRFTFRGVAGIGEGDLLLQDGKVVGADVAGAAFDGTYSVRNGEVDLRVQITIPAGVMTVQGQSMNHPWTFGASAVFPASAALHDGVATTDLGQVSVRIQLIRRLAARAA
jgi:hypothetical protein